MAEETITFELIRRIHMDEQRIPSLTKLPQNFFQSVLDYLSQKKQLEIDDRKNVLELRSIENMVQNIFDRRERKILNYAIIAARTGLPPENLVEEEKPFYKSVLSLIKARRSELFKMPAKESKPEVVFKEDVPEFVGIDEKTYGPFKKGDKAVLPEENMKIFLEREIVEETF
ncbi:MAG: DNA replication complex GINS family protein [Candidatus Aenigmarchaeota archaeon]|nr:DNA replication complex GINS family protein [Candidatus Aenigmarchaeota archaeon]